MPNPLDEKEAGKWKNESLSSPTVDEFQFTSRFHLILFIP